MLLSCVVACRHPNDELNYCYYLIPCGKPGYCGDVTESDLARLHNDAITKVRPTPLLVRHAVQSIFAGGVLSAWQPQASSQMCPQLRDSVHEHGVSSSKIAIGACMHVRSTALRHHVMPMQTQLTST